MTTKRRPPRRGGRPKGRAEEKYIGLRTLFNHSNFDSFLNDERYDQTLMMALRKEHGSNNAETMATMKLGGFLETFKKNLKFTATRKDMVRFFKIVESNRLDKKLITFEWTEAKEISTNDMIVFPIPTYYKDLSHEFTISTNKLLSFK